MHALLLILLPLDVREIDVDLLETNTVLNPTGEVRFSQVWALDVVQGEHGGLQWVNRGYKVRKDGYPAVHVYGGHYRVVWWCGPGKVYVLRSKVHLVTETPYDREAKFRECGGRFAPCW